jgi:hypothetical protein
MKNSVESEEFIADVMKKMGRPLVGDKPKNKRSEIRMDEDEKERLTALAGDNGMSISQYVNFLVKKEWELKNEK